jgi:hypothetical protein
MIAHEAKVDPALVARAFDGKHGLFLAAVRWPWDPADVVPAVAAGPKTRAGHRITKLVIDTWEDPDQRAPIVTLLTSVGVSDVARKLLGDFITTQVQVPFARACGFDQPELRGALVGAHSVGLCLARYVLAIEPLASMDTAALIDVAGDVTTDPHGQAPGGRHRRHDPPHRGRPALNLTRNRSGRVHPLPVRIVNRRLRGQGGGAGAR